MPADTTSEPASRAALRLLLTRRFGTFCGASFLSNIGTWAQQLAQPWLLLSLGASSFFIGLDAFAQGAPVWLLTLVGGVLADRFDRRRIIASFQSLQMLCPLLIMTLLLTHAIQPWMVICASLVVGITDALSMPSFSSIVPSIVTKKQIPTALSLNSTQFNLSRIAGPALAGLLLTSIGAVGCYAANALSYIPFILVALWILPHQRQRAAPLPAFERRHPFRGVRHIVEQPLWRGALLTVLTSSLLCGQLITFCPVLVRSAFHGNAAQLSIAMGAFGLGGLMGALGLVFINPLRDRRPFSSGFAMAFGAILVLAALNPWQWGLPALMTLAGIAMCVSNTSANTLLQATTADNLRGETVSLYMLAMRGGTSLGGLLTGASISLLGVREALLVNGLLAMSAQLFIAWYWRRAPGPQLP